MLKRTKGRILLALLVVTGLAGTLKNSSLTQKERKYITTQIKESKVTILEDLKVLSNTQLNFHPSKGEASIRETFYELNRVEEGMWRLLDAAVSLPPMPEHRNEVNFTDAQVIEAIRNNDIEMFIPANFQPATQTWKNLAQAVGTFRSNRAQRLKYARTTTEDLRNHLIKVPGGTLDCYQFMLVVESYTQRYIHNVNKIKSLPSFPQ